MLLKCLWRLSLAGHKCRISPAFVFHIIPPHGNGGGHDPWSIYSAQQFPYQAPVPLSIFRSNSKFDENSEWSSFKYIPPITTIFCTRHDSDTVVTCAKYRCDRLRIFYTRVFWISLEFRIRSKYAWWDGRQTSNVISRKMCPDTETIITKERKINIRAATLVTYVAKPPAAMVLIVYTKWIFAINQVRFNYLCRAE